MSIRSELKANLMRVVAQSGGAHLTREARSRTVARIARILIGGGYRHVHSARDIASKHVVYYVTVRRDAGVAVRTLHNELAHLRMLLRASGRGAFARDIKISNASLGLTGGSRIGKKIAVTAAEFDDVVGRAIAHGRDGIAAALRLQRWMGLRGNESIHATAPVLERWLRELADGRHLAVTDGTKGGRARDVLIFNRAEVTDAIIEARSIAVKNEGFLISRMNGRPAGGLREARSIYHGWCYRAGLQPHALRYAWAQSQLSCYRAAGYSEREARRALARDLGHGVSRERYVVSVYARASLSHVSPEDRVEKRS